MTITITSNTNALSESLLGGCFIATTDKDKKPLLSTNTSTVVNTLDWMNLLVFSIVKLCVEILGVSLEHE